MTTTRILLVEDESHLAFGLSWHMSQEGWEIRIAETLAAARDLLDSSVHVVVLDRMLPDGDGIDFCRNLRASANWVPVLMLTARDAPDAIVQGLEAGADDYITKPARPPELIGRIHAQLRRVEWLRAAREGRSVPAPFDGIEINGVRVDFATHRYESAAENGELTALEIRLLRYFLEHSGRVVPRAELLEEVWGLSANVNTRTVDNFIMRLRRLLEPDAGSATVLHTVRGTGYRFERP